MGKEWENTGAVFATALGDQTHPDNLKRALSSLLEWSDPARFKKRAGGVTKMATREALAQLESVVMAGESLPGISPLAPRFASYLRHVGPAARNAG